MSSVPPLHEDNEVAGFLADVRAAYVKDPDEALASRHLAQIAREAELIGGSRTPRRAGWRRTMNRNRFLRPAVTLGAATLAAALGTAGLAVAGVDLPDPATEAFERVGISLPNQAGGGESGENARSDEVRSVIEGTSPSDRDCTFGHRVAETVKGSPLPEEAGAACANGDGDGGGDAADTGAGANSNNSEFGRETAERARGLGDATVEERRSFGEDTADRAKQLGGGPEGTHAPEQRPESPPADTPVPEGTPGPPEATPDGPPDGTPIPEGTPTGPPDDLPGGRP
jgi:hypothetical protein